jgi:hypothetical protein
MYQKDYILRMIEMLGELIRAILGLVTKGNYQQAQDKINEAYLTFLRKDAAFFQRIPADQLTTTLLMDHNYTHGHLEILAELFNAEARIKEARGLEPESLIFYEKSLTLFSFIEETDRTYSADRIEMMNRIRQRISELGKLKQG